MADVFISYSRKDKEFVRYLHEALAQHNRDTWVDWQDIPLTANWWQEICTGIEGADAFVFIITPDSVRSQVCFDEIDHATRNNKRIIPILHRDITEHADRQLTHPIISTHNWIFIRASDEFTAAFQSLITALDTDLDYVRTHTRLLVRALEWATKDRENSLLLRGKDLTEAEAWLTRSVSKKPDPTQLHSDFIAASREAQTRRQRTLLSAVSLALIVTLALVALSLVLFRQSEDRRTQAEINLREAWNTQALFLASLSREQTSAGAERQGILLALEGLNHYQDGIFNPENHQALLDSLSVTGGELFALENDTDWYDGKWSYDGTQIHARDADSVIIWNAATGTKKFVFEHGTELNGIEWNADETRVLTIGSDQVARVWDARNGELLSNLQHAAPVTLAQWSPDSTRIMTATVNGDLQLWETNTGTRLAERSGELLGIETIEWHPVGNLIATWEVEPDGQPVVVIRDAVTLTRRYAMRYDDITDSDYWGLRWNSNGSQLLIWYGDTVRLWDAGRERFDLPHIEVYSARWNHNETQLITESDDRTKVWDTATGELLYTVDGNLAVWNNDHTRLFTTRPFMIQVWDAATGELLFELEETRGAMWNHDGTRLLSWGKGFTIHDAKTGETQVKVSDQSYAINSAAWSRDEKRLLLTDGHFVRIWNLDAAQPESSLLHTSHVYTAQWNPDETLVLSRTLAFDSNVLYVWDVTRRPAVFSVKPESGVYNAVLSKDETRLLLQTYDEVQIWEMNQRELLFSLPIEEGTFRGAVWNADETRLLTWADSPYDCKTDCPYTVQIRDIASNQPLLTISEDGNVNSVQWNADETRLLTVNTSPALCETNCTDGVKIWDAQSGELLLKIPFKPDDFVGNAEWSRDETRLLIRTDNGNVQIRDAVIGELLFTHQPMNRDVAGALWNHDETRLLVWSNGEYMIEDCPQNCPYKVSIVEVASGKTLFEVEHHQGVHGAVWNADETRVLSWSQDGTARVWDAQTGEQQLLLEHERGWVDEAIWNTDETRIVTISSIADTAILWDAVTGEKLLTLTPTSWNLGGASSGSGARWNSDSTQLLTWSDDNTFKLWLLNLDQLIVLAEAMNLRPLSNTERSQFFLPTLQPTDIPTLLPTYTPLPTLTPSQTPTLQPALSTGNELFSSAEGELVHGDATTRQYVLPSVDAAVSISDFVAEARFFNPFDVSENSWDYGFVFRDASNDYCYALVITSDKQWWLLFRHSGETSTIGRGEISNLNIGRGESNLLRVTVQGEQLVFTVNGIQIAASGNLLFQGAGTVKAASGIFDGTEVEGASTHYTGFTVWTVR